MIRAVGETLVVNMLFLALGVTMSSYDGDFSDVTGLSALFSILQLSHGAPVLRRQGGDVHGANQSALRTAGGRCPIFERRQGRATGGVANVEQLIPSRNHRVGKSRPSRPLRAALPKRHRPRSLRERMPNL